MSDYRVHSQKTYEMLWDCKYCGQTKLLGLSHRHCASCGAPQDPASRYYPDEANKVAVEDHAFVGADVRCRACQAPNSRAAKCCTNCGGPLAEGQAVAAHAAQTQNEGAAGHPAFGEGQKLGAMPQGPGPQATPPKKPRTGLWIGLGIAGVVLVGILGVVVVAFVWTKPGSFEVAGATWERTIDIERYGPVTKTAWCDAVPAGARVISRRQMQRSTTKVPDGEDCRMVRKDNGDGTYTESRECKTRYKNKPVMDDECRYEAMDWSRVRTEKSTGSGGDMPAWPETNIAKNGSCVGCERTADRKETYALEVREPKSKDTETCTMNEAKWALLRKKKKVYGETRVVGGVVVCDSLAEQPAK